MLLQDYDLCNKCQETVSHQHKLEKVLVEVGGEDKQDSVNSRNESIQVTLDFIHFNQS